MATRLGTVTRVTSLDARAEAFARLIEADLLRYYAIAAAMQPVALGPGEEVVLVVAWVAGSCADPTADVTFHGSGSWAARPFVNVVYDVVGWRRQGWTYAPFDISAPATPGCLPPFFVQYP